MSKTKRSRISGMAAAIVLASLAGTPAANSQTAPCGARQTMADTLSTQYKEQRHAVGLVGANGVVELYVSEGGSWTLLVTTTSGESCIVAAGHSWESMPIKLGSGA